MIINKSYFEKDRPRFLCHKEKMLENLAPISRVGVDLQVIQEWTQLFWNVSRFTMIEKFVKWELLLTCHELSDLELAKLLSSKLAFDSIKLEPHGVRISFDPRYRKIMDPILAAELDSVPIEKVKQSRQKKVIICPVPGKEQCASERIKNYDLTKGLIG